MLHLEFVRGDQRFWMDVPENMSMSTLKMMVSERLSGSGQQDFDFRVDKGILRDEGTIGEQGIANNTVIFLDDSRKIGGSAGRQGRCGNPSCTCADCQCTTACTCGN